MKLIIEHKVSEFYWILHLYMHAIQQKQFFHIKNEIITEKSTKNWDPLQKVEVLFQSKQFAIIVAIIWRLWNCRFYNFVSNKINCLKLTELVELKKKWKTCLEKVFDVTSLCDLSLCFKDFDTPMMLLFP